MARHPAQVRLTDTDHDFISRQATIVGESLSEFMRTAALARAWVVYIRNNAEQAGELETVYEAAARLLGEETARRRGRTSGRSDGSGGVGGG